MKPIIKWVGGKTQILDKVLKTFPREIENYHELFVGGGSVLFGLLESKDITVKGKVYAYDKNQKLINMYRQIQTNPNEIHDHLIKLFTTYDTRTGTEVNRKPESEEEGLTSKESYYYWVRKTYNDLIPNTPIHTATLIFLNKTCFRGLYREGPNGFNVPYGHYKTTPVVITLEDVLKIQDLIKNVVFKWCDFRAAFAQTINDGDFIYADPPYAPESVRSFVGYMRDGFDINDHEDLFNLLKRSDIDFVMSNAKVYLVTNSFKDYKIEEVPVRRAIHSKNPGSSTIEVLVHGCNREMA
jgi:DNA adenine methylase